MDLSFSFELEMLGRIILAALCGAIIGYERKNRKKEAGIRTHIIVSLASALMMIVSKYGFFDLKDGFLGIRGADPSRIASQVISGVGFLGAGMIFVNKKAITGLTTAAGIWATSGIGIAIGSGLYFIGIAAALLIVAAQILLHKNFVFLRAENHETLLLVARDFENTFLQIEKMLEPLGISTEEVSLKKLSNNRTEAEISLSGNGLYSNGIMTAIYSVEGVETVKVI